MRRLDNHTIENLQRRGVPLPLVIAITVFSIFDSSTVASEFQPADVTPPLSTASSQPAEADGGVETSPIIEAVKLITGENTDEARRIGVRNLIRDETPDAIAELKRILSSADAGKSDIAAREAICYVLARQDNPPAELLDALLGLVGMSSRISTDTLHSSLASYPQREVMAGLRHIATNATVESTRRVAAIDMVNRIGEDFTTVGMLAGLLGNEDAPVRRASLSAFSTIAGKSFDSSESALEWWQKWSGRDEREWLERTNRRRRAENQSLAAERAALVERLVAAYRDSFLQLSEASQGPRLVELLGDTVPEVRALALGLIGKLVIDQKEVPTEVRSAVLKILDDPVADLRRRAAETAGNLRIKGATDALLAALEAERRPSVRAALASALGRLDDPRAIGPLISALNSGDDEQVADIANSLGKLARPAQVSKEEKQRVVNALLERFNSIPTEATELRAQMLRAMGQIGAIEFRTLFEQEASPDRSVAVRSAAIAGLSSVDSVESAEFLVRQLGDAEPTIRVAAIQALGISGAQLSHFQALRERTDPAIETDSAVRDRAWEAAQQVFSRLGGPTRITAIDSLNIEGDPVAQRRRAALANLLVSDETTMAELSATARSKVLRNMADALFAAGEFGGALRSWTLIADRNADPSFELLCEIDYGIARSALFAEQYDAIATRIEAAKTAIDGIDAKERMRSLIDSLLPDIERRIDTASAAAALDSIDNLLIHLSDSSDERNAGIAGTRDRLEARRIAVIDELLSSDTPGPTAVNHLMAFEKRLLLERIHAALSTIPTTTTGPSANERETSLIALARQIAPEWVAYEPGCPPEQREAALAALTAG